MCVAGKKGKGTLLNCWSDNLRGSANREKGCFMNTENNLKVIKMLNELTGIRVS